MIDRADREAAGAVSELAAKADGVYPKALSGLLLILRVNELSSHDFDGQF